MPNTRWVFYRGNVDRRVMNVIRCDLSWGTAVRRERRFAIGQDRLSVNLAEFRLQCRSNHFDLIHERQDNSQYRRAVLLAMGQPRMGAADRRRGRRSVRRPCMATERLYGAGALPFLGATS